MAYIPSDTGPLGVLSQNRGIHASDGGPQPLGGRLVGIDLAPSAFLPRIAINNLNIITGNLFDDATI